MGLRRRDRSLALDQARVAAAGDRRPDEQVDTHCLSNGIPPLRVARNSSIELPHGIWAIAKQAAARAIGPTRELRPDQPERSAACRHQWSITATTSAGRVRMGTWPAPGITTSFESGIAWAAISAVAMGMIRSYSPWMIRVGTRIDERLGAGLASA